MAQDIATEFGCRDLVLIFVFKLFSFALRGSYVAQVISTYQAFSSRADLKKGPPGCLFAKI